MMAEVEAAPIPEQQPQDGGQDQPAGQQQGGGDNAGSLIDDAKVSSECKMFESFLDKTVSL